ncbi:hypothetical protein KFL_001840020 [Klebsormidium nitens]|uniref:F-box domain-containing protein n=1 Tax=Klebsormidium nitens TaxID=105231 RepID=A0A1Y1I1G0_KLENI|nr:hypothetical protein KFL_001840020 [Klebsormidium nitens]|eukprot:GAQ84303.1 hypothetical protein KFL_001840020 [Klebsormidium nitens]
MGTLQELPRDVLLMILHKLATTKGPRTLLLSTCACKALGSAAESAPGFWKAAFWFRSNVSEFCEEDFAAFEAEVEALGGYKRLLAARAASFRPSERIDQDGNKRGQPEQTQREQSQALETSVTAAGPKDELKPEITGRVLALLQVKDKPVAFGAFNPWENTDQAAPSSAKTVTAKRLRLRPLVPLDDARNEIAAIHKLVTLTLDYARDVEQTLNTVAKSAPAMGGLQDLPSDVLLIILYKLASRQGPRTLLIATFACKALETAAESVPGFWKAAFLFPAVLNDFCKDDFEAFEAEVEALGGYKRLLAAGAANFGPFKRSEREASNSLSKSCTSAIPKAALKPGIAGSVLALLCLKTKPVAFGILNPWEDSGQAAPGSAEKVITIKRSGLRPLVPLEEVRKEIAAIRKVQAAQEQASEPPPAAKLSTQLAVACLVRSDGRSLQIIGAEMITPTCTLFRRQSCLESRYSVEYNFQQMRPLGSYVWLNDRLCKVRSEERATWRACLGCCAPRDVTEPLELTNAPPAVAKVAEEAFEEISGVRGWEYIFGPGYYDLNEKSGGPEQHVTAGPTKVSDALVALMTRRPSGLTPSLVVQTYPGVTHEGRPVNIGYGISPVDEFSNTLFGSTHGASNPKYQLWAVEGLLPMLDEEIFFISEE